MSRLALLVPVIAAVNGMAIGAGFCLALLADMRIAAKGTKVGLNFSRIGMHSGMAGSVRSCDQSRTRLVLTAATRPSCSTLCQSWSALRSLPRCF